MKAAATALLLGLLASPALPGEMPTGGGPAGGAPAEARQAVDDHGLTRLWHARRQARAAGEIVAAGEAEEALRSRRRRDAVTRSENIAGALVLEGFDHLELQHFSDAVEAFVLATEFDPEMPEAYLGLARTRWESEGAFSAVGPLLRGAGAAWSNWLIRQVGLHRGLWALLLGLPLAAGLLCTLLFLKRFSLIQHRLQEALARRLPSTTAATLAFLLPWLPLALPWGVAWLPLLWLVLAAPFLTGRERVTSVAALAAAALCGVVLLPAATSTARNLDPRLLHVAEAARGSVGPERVRTLTELAEASPDDAVLELLLADQHRGMGLHSEAVRHYQRAMDLDGALHAARNNAGSLFFSVGQYRTAARWFREAIEIDPRAMVAHYNLYLTQEHLFDFAAAESTLSAAQSIDMDRMTRLLSERDRRQERLDVLNERVPVSVALQHAREAIGPGGSAMLSAAAAGAWPFLVFPAAVVGLAFLRSPRRGRLPRRCLSCGRVACRRCALNLERDRTCVSCVALAQRSTALPRRTREAKLAEIAAYRNGRRRVERLLGLVLPGSRQLWRGQTVTGATLLALAACAGTFLLARELVPPPVYVPLPTEALAPVTLAPLAAVAGLAWLVGLLLPGGPEAVGPLPRLQLAPASRDEN